MDERAIVVRMPAELHDAVKAKAIAEGRSIAQAMRHALQVYVERDPAVWAHEQIGWVYLHVDGAVVGFSTDPEPRDPSGRARNDVVAEPVYRRTRVRLEVA